MQQVFKEGFVYYFRVMVKPTSAFQVKNFGVMIPVPPETAQFELKALTPRMRACGERPLTMPNAVSFQRNSADIPNAAPLRRAAEATIVASRHQRHDLPSL